MTAVLLALWRARGEQGVPLPIQSIVTQTHLPLPAVQISLETLESRGCRLERSPAGVVLLEASLSCWRDVLEDQAKRSGRVLGKRVLVHSRTTSTNDTAWQHASAPDADGLAVLADEQTAGRGRPGHTWLAHAGQSVLLSVLIARTTAISINRLTLLAGLATALTLERVFERAGLPPPRVEIKWPNDLFLHGKKIAGVLVERRPLSSMEEAPAVIGVGINVKQEISDFPTELRDRATSLFLGGVRPAPDRLSVAALLLDALSEFCHASSLNEDAWILQWKQRCTLLGKLISLRSGTATVTGHVEDISPLQGLIIKDATGAVRFVSAQTSSLL